MTQKLEVTKRKGFGYHPLNSQWQFETVSWKRVGFFMHVSKNEQQDKDRDNTHSQWTKQDKGQKMNTGISLIKTKKKTTDLLFPHTRLNFGSATSYFSSKFGGFADYRDGCEVAMFL